MIETRHARRSVRGVPLVSAWVSGPNYTDIDGEALELFAETDPDEAAALSAY